MLLKRVNAFSVNVGLFLEIMLCFTFEFVFLVSKSLQGRLTFIAFLHVGMVFLLLMQGV